MQTQVNDHGPGSTAHLRQLAALVPSVTDLVVPHLIALASHKRLHVRADESGARFLVTAADERPDPAKHVRLLGAGKEALVITVPGQDSSSPLLVKASCFRLKDDEAGRVAELKIRYDVKLGQQSSMQMAGDPVVLSQRLRELLPGAVPMIVQQQFPVPKSKVPVGNFCLVENLRRHGEMLLEFGQVQDGYSSCEEAVLALASNGAALLQERTEVQAILDGLDTGDVPGLVGIGCGQISLAVQIEADKKGRLVLIDLQSAALVDLSKLGLEGSGTLDELQMP